MDPVLEILIAELHRQGLLDGEAISGMAARLERASQHDEAEALRMVAISNLLDTPEARRSTIHAVDGGNSTD